MLDAALGRLQIASHQREQRGLTRAVHAQDAGALAGGNTPGDLLQHRALAAGHRGVVVGDRDVFEVYHVLAEAGDRHLLQLHRVTHRRNVRNEGVRGINAELRLGGTRGRTAAQPSELLTHQVLALRLSCGCLAVTFHALQDVRRVTTLEGLDDAVVHLPGVGADFVEEPAVVGDDHETAGVLRPAGLQVVGEPGNGLDIQVVGGLVEHEHVPLLREQGGERYAAALTTRKRRNRRVPGQVGNQTGDNVADARLGRPLIFGGVAHNCVADRVVVVEYIGLVEVADAGAAAHGDAAGVWFEPTGKDLHEGGLAVAVATDNAYAVAFVQADRDAFKDGSGREFEVQRFAAK